MAEEASGRAFAATWRDEQGEVVSTTSAKTMCLWPRLPWRIRFHADGFEGVIPCRECPGCLELDRMRLAERLHAKYGLSNSPSVGGRRGRASKVGQGQPPSPQAMYVVRIFAPLERHAQLAHALHRRKGLSLEPGMWRLGASSFAVLSRAKEPIAYALRRLCLRARIEPLRLRRGRRAWRPLTAGLLVAREVYGEQRNRFYAKGLPPVDKQQWEVRKIGEYKSYNRARSPRAWNGRKLVLLPPDVWQLSRTDRRALRGLLTKQADPEGVRRVMGIVADTIRNAGRRLLVSAAAKPLLDREVVAQWYKRNAERAAARTALTESNRSIPPLSEAGGYTSSVHNQGELMPEELARARRKEDDEARKARLIRESMEIIERMRKKAGPGW